MKFSKLFLVSFGILASAQFSLADKSSSLLYIPPGIKFSFHVKAYIKAGDAAIFQLSGASDSLCEIWLPRGNDNFDETFDVDIAGLTGDEMVAEDYRIMVGQDFMVNGKPTPDILLDCEDTTIGGFMNFIKSIGGKIDDSLPPPIPYGSPTPAPPVLAPTDPGFGEQQIDALPIGTQINFALNGANNTGIFGGPNVLGIPDRAYPGYCELTLPKSYPNSQQKAFTIQVSVTVSAQNKVLNPGTIDLEDLTITGAKKPKWFEGSTIHCVDAETIEQFEREINLLGGTVKFPTLK